MNNSEQKPQSCQTSVMCRAGEEIGLKDTNGNDIFIGSVIKHNENLYVIKWSKSQKGIVARSEPLAGKKANWRDFNWIKNLSDKYITIVGTVLFDDEELKARFKGVY